MRRVLPCLVATCVAVAAAGAQSAGVSPVGRRLSPEAQAIINETMSPFCPGLTLANCPSPSADSLRRLIHARIERGESRASIEADLQRDFGDAVQAVPRFRGFGAVAWLMPPALLVGGGGALWWWLRRLRRATDVARRGVPAVAVAAPAPSARSDHGADDSRLLATLAALVRDDVPGVRPDRDSPSARAPRPHSAR